MEERHAAEMLMPLVFKRYAQRQSIPIQFHLSSSLILEPQRTRFREWDSSDSFEERTTNPL